MDITSEERVQLEMLAKMDYCWSAVRINYPPAQTLIVKGLVYEREIGIGGFETSITPVGRAALNQS